LLTDADIVAQKINAMISVNRSAKLKKLSNATNGSNMGFLISNHSPKIHCH